MGPARTGRSWARSLPSESGAITNTWSPDGPRRTALTGMTTASIAGPAGTRTRTEEPGAGILEPAIVARTIVLRVAGSTRESTATIRPGRSEEHTSELQSLRHLVCRL